MSQPLADLIAGWPVELIGDGQRRLSGAEPLATAGAEDMAFLLGKENLPLAEQSAAAVLFVEPQWSGHLREQNAERTLVLCDDPKGAFFFALRRLRPIRQRSNLGQSPHAFIHPDVQIGQGSNVHPGAVIESDVVMGAECEISPGVYIGHGTRLGDGVHLHPNVVLYHDLVIGDRVSIQAGSVVGADGFGYQSREGRHERLHHFGTVRIEDDVDIGGCTTIDRALVGATVIGRGTKIDNNVVIAHNCQLGAHNLLVSQVGFAGSVTTEDYVVCAGQVGVADHVHIGEGAILGAKAGVHKDLAGGRSYLGSPAAPVAEATRSVMALQKLPQLRQCVRDIERQLTALKAKLEDAETTDPAPR